jgi:hypothetical protein
MRLYEFTGRTIEEMLAEIDRRGFLKGLGAAAGLAALGKSSDATASDTTSMEAILSSVKQNMEKEFKVKKGTVSYIHVVPGTSSVMGWVRPSPGTTTVFIYDLKKGFIGFLKDPHSIDSIPDNYKKAKQQVKPLKQDL